VNLIGAISLELIVGKLDLDWSLPSSQASEALVRLRWRVVVFDLELDLRGGISFLGLFSGIGSFLFLLVLLLFFLLLVGLVITCLLSLVLR
jgi:hypothetical protein